MTMKIGIIGAGAIGCFVGGHLIDKDTNVFFLGRARLGDEIKKTGLTITSLEGPSIHQTPDTINWILDPANLPLLDLIIIATKSQDTLSAITEIKSKIQNNTVIVSLQNGLDNTDILKTFLPHHKIVTGMVLYNVIQVDNKAHFKQSSSGVIYLSESIEVLIKAMKAKVVLDIAAIQWGKLVKNLNNALNALSNKPLALQLRNKKERLLISHVMEEALLVLNKNSIPVKNTSALPLWIFPIILKLPNAIFSFVAKKEIAIDPEARLSMWQDLELKRKTEIEYLNGKIVKMAMEQGIHAPYNEKITGLIHLAENGELQAARAQYEQLVKTYF